jgi:hypothetical protein
MICVDGLLKAALEDVHNLVFNELHILVFNEVFSCMRAVTSGHRFQMSLWVRLLNSHRCCSFFAMNLALFSSLKGSSFHPGVSSLPQLGDGYPTAV